MSTRFTRNATTYSQKRLVRCQTAELYSDGNQYVENNLNLVGFIEEAGVPEFYAGRDHISVGKPQLSIPVE
jgi:hypothetical protein